LLVKQKKKSIFEKCFRLGKDCFFHLLGKIAGGLYGWWLSYEINKELEEILEQAKEDIKEKRFLTREEVFEEE